MSKDKAPKKDDRSSSDAYERAKEVRARRDAEDAAAREQAQKNAQREQTAKDWSQGKKK